MDARTRRRSRQMMKARRANPGAQGMAMRDKGTRYRKPSKRKRKIPGELYTPPPKKGYTPTDDPDMPYMKGRYKKGPGGRAMPAVKPAMGSKRGKSSRH